MAQEVQLLINRTITTYQILNNEDCNELLYNLIDHYPNGDAGMMSVHSTLPQWITWCIDHGAPVDIPNQDGTTPLMLAVAGGGRNQVRAYDDIVEILIKAGANPDQKQRGNDTAYHTPRTFIEKRLEQYKEPENIRAKELLTKAPAATAPRTDPTAPQKSHSLSLPKVGLLCAGAVITYFGLHKLYAYLYPEQDDEAEDAQDETAPQENTPEADIIP